ncbi:MAG TPA: serine/threonine-protein kinase, partial [Thermoanaerobaculia bacterium]|nr:serine/threonine-protein kinase [Thermoanaerobaculia bacterium]
MSETRPPVDAPVRIDRYEVIAELGRGSMGKVYLAHDPNTDRRVALKVRSARTDTEPEEERSSRARFLLEGRAAGRLQHPGIVVVYDADTDTETGQAFLAMEWIEGQSLATLLKRKGPMAWATAARIAGEVALALDHAHERGVVHRDVKPENILIGVDGRVKVSDFGIAKVVAAEPRTLAGEVLGTPHYMSPEQLRSDPLDGRSDLFSLGAVLYEMLAGVPPFPGDTIASVTYKIAWVDPQPPSIARDDLPASLEKIVLRLLAKAPDDRFARGREVADALAAVIADPGETSRTATLPAPVGPEAVASGAGPGAASRRTRLVRGLAAFAVATLAATAILLWSRSAPSAPAAGEARAAAGSPHPS